jgi:hypothetical protein
MLLALLLFAAVRPLDAVNSGARLRRPGGRRRGRTRFVELPALAFEALQGRQRLDGAERCRRLDDEVARIFVQAREQRRPGARVAAAGQAGEELAGGVPVGVIEPRRQRVADGFRVLILAE